MLILIGNIIKYKLLCGVNWNRVEISFIYLFYDYFTMDYIYRRVVCFGWGMIYKVEGWV